MRNREKEHKKAETVGLLLTLVMAASFGVLAYTFANTPKSQQPISYPQGGRPILSLDLLGQPSTLAAASRTIGVGLGLPTYLPSGAKLISVRSTTNLVGLVYYAANSPYIPFYTPNATLIVTIQRDDSSFASSLATPLRQPIALVDTGNGNQSVSLSVTTLGVDRVILAVSGHQGWGFGPSDSNGYHDSGRLEWWAKGLHYTVLGDLPLDELLRIAQSMNT